MAPFDQFGPYLVAAILATTVGLGLYTAYLRSRLAGVRQQLERMGRSNHKEGP